MNRRDLLKMIAAITGTAMAGGDFFLSGCQHQDQPVTGIFTADDIAFFDEVAETIIPKTDTPGARDAAVGRFMAMYSTDCYTSEQITALKDGIDKLNDEAYRRYGIHFLRLAAEKREELLAAIDGEAVIYNKQNAGTATKEVPPHYFTLMKQLTLLGFFTSKPGVTQALRYVPVPGKYQGCIDYNNETAWA